MGHVAVAAEATARQVKQDYDAAQATISTAAQDSAVRGMDRPSLWDPLGRPCLDSAAELASVTRSPEEALPSFMQAALLATRSLSKRLKHAGDDVGALSSVRREVALLAEAMGTCLQQVWQGRRG